MSLHERIRSDLTGAMKSRDRGRVRVLRSLLTTIGNAEAVTDLAAFSEQTIGNYSTEVDRRVLSDHDVLELLKSEIRELLDAEAVYRNAGVEDRAESIRDDIELLEGYLTDDESPRP